MKSIKNKLSSKSGASMLLALVFLLFCLMVGGSVLSAATANGSRAARQKENQQAYLSQRSASLLLADMLKSTDDAAMQLTIKDVQGNGARTITFMAHGKGPQSNLQKLLYDIQVAEHIKDLGSEKYIAKFVNFPDGYTAPTGMIENGTIKISLDSTKVKDDVYAKYYTVDGDFVVDYDVTIPPAEVGGESVQQHSYLDLIMKCYKAVGNPVKVNDVTTTTTIIRWDDPVIEKGGA